jgi:mannosyltransferase
MAEPKISLEIILGNSNKRFSGVTSTMLQVLPYQQRQAQVFVLGNHHLPADVPSLTFLQAIVRLRKKAPKGTKRVFHARRNDEMIQALLLKKVFRCKLKIVFTSTAQREKSWITKWLMKQMDGLITTCSAAAHYMPIPPDIVVPHGIDPNLYSPDKPYTNRVPFENAIGIFGRVRAQKGVDLFVDALLEILPEYPTWGGVIVGEITVEQKAFQKSLQSQLKSKGLQERVLFTDKVPFNQLADYFLSVDIVCALSINEGFGLTVLEALSSGKPVVATKAGAWPDIITPDMGRLIEVGDKAALVQALGEMMSNPELRNLMAQQGRELIQGRYTVSREADQLISFYQHV